MDGAYLASIGLPCCTQLLATLRVRQVQGPFALVSAGKCTTEVEVGSYRHLSDACVDSEKKGKKGGNVATGKLKADGALAPSASVPLTDAANMGKNKKGGTSKGASVPIKTASAAPLCGLVDVDANFLHEDMQTDLEHHLKQAHAAGVEKFLTPVCTLADCQPGLDLTKKYPGEIFVTMGVHPFWTTATVGGEARDHGVDFSEEALQKLRSFAEKPEVCGIGECGLDFCRGPNEPNGFPASEVQLPWCEAQVKLACELKKPLFLHVRHAFDQFMPIVEHHRASLPRALVHAFTGSEQELEAYRNLDFYIGVTGFICQKSQPLREFLPRHVPLDRLMVETDAPYMGFKGCRALEPDKKKDKYPNVPAALPKVVEAVAECYGVSPAEVVARTSANACDFFRMG